MRPIYALLISICLLAGVYKYIAFAKRVRRPPVEIQVDYAQGDFSLEIDRSFDCEGDPIFGSESLKVLFKGETVYSQQDPIDRDQPVVIEDLQGVEAGENEIFVSANQKPPSASLAVMKVTVKRNGVSIAEHIVTSESGLPAVGGPVAFTIGDSVDQSDQHSHQH